MNREQKRKFVADLMRDNCSFKQKYHQFILNLPDKDIEENLSYLNNNSKIRKKYNSLLFPKTLKRLSNTDWYLSSAIDTEKIVLFCNHVLNNYSNSIDKYLNLKSTLEDSLCAKEYYKSLDIINKIEEEFGYSVWVLLKRITIIELLYGFEEHKRYVSKLHEKLNNNLLIGTILDLHSLFTEHKTNYSTYKKKTESLKGSLINNKIIYHYFDFKLCPERTLNEGEMRTALMIDAQLSLIDMYESFVITCQALYLKDKLNYSPIFINNDCRLLNIIRIKNNNPALSYDSEYYSILDLYTCGHYKQCIKKCIERLNNKPSDFQCMILLVKSHLLCNEKLVYHNELCNWLYDVYSFNGKENEAIQNLLSSLKIYTGTSLEYKILGFVSRKTFMDRYELSIRMSILCDNNLSPNITNFADLVHSTSELLENFYVVCPVTAKLYKFKYGYGEFPQEVIDFDRRYLFKAEKCIANNECDKALDYINKISRNDNYMSERVLGRRIRAYRVSGNYLEMVKCIDLFTLNNPSLKSRQNLPLLFNEVKKHLTPELKRSMYYVVFVSICHTGDVRKIRIAYSNFMEGNRLSSLDDICKHEENTRVLIEFLYSVCTKPILMRDKILNPSFKKADDVRIEILKKLVDLDYARVKLYYSEISSITKEKSIKERIRLINNSKIYVDTEGIKCVLREELKEDFSRYLELQKLNEDVIAFDYESIDYKKEIISIFTKKSDINNSNFVYSQRTILLREIVSRITEEFLFNESYGLNTFLSIRIRHGYLKSQLTRVFENNNLLSKRKTNSSVEYSINEYWDDILPNDTKGGKEIRQCLSSFTLSIQNMINTVKNEWLNIQYKDDTLGFFLDYCPVVGIIIDQINPDIRDFNDFYNNTINILWEYTDSLFRILRERINNSLIPYVGDALNKLSNSLLEIKDASVKEALEELIKSINLCKAGYEQSIIEFSKVLERNQVSYWNFTMDELVDTSLGIENQLNTKFKKVNIQRSIFDSSSYKGVYFPYFVDVLTILLNNAFEHSGIVRYKDMCIAICIDKNGRERLEKVGFDNFYEIIGQIKGDDYFYISVTNKLSKQMNIEKLNNDLRDLFKRINHADALKEYSQTEGGSGLAKLSNTLKYNIDENYSILYYFPDKTHLCFIVTFSINNIIFHGETAK